MNLEIELNVKPITLNHYTKITTRGKFASKYKPKETQDWEMQVTEMLDFYQKKFLEFNALYDSKKHYLVADYNFYLPFMTKKGLVAKRKNDVDNLIKPINDQVFKYLAADDSQIVSLSATKIHSENCKIKINIHIKNLRDIK